MQFVKVMVHKIVLIIIKKLNFIKQNLKISIRKTKLLNPVET